MRSCLTPLDKFRDGRHACSVSSDAVTTTWMSHPDAMTERLKNEPALIVGFVQALLTLGLSFGLDLDSAQVGAILAVVTAMTAVLLRQQVSPARPLPGAGQSGLVRTPEVAG